MPSLIAVISLLFLFIHKIYGGFVTTKGKDFMLDGKVFRFAGANNYYLIYEDKFMVDNVLQTAANRGFKVIRIWGFIDIGYQNGSNSADQNYPIKGDGIYFQYFDPVAMEPTFNDTNLRMLDYVLYKAGSLNLKILITLTNNWSDFGGMDQYLIYRQMQDPSVKLYHDSFYNDSNIIQMYKNWVSYLIQRQNYYNDVTYSNDDTIFAWELANEPRCQGSGGFPSTNTCTYGLYHDPWAWKITAWVQEMSAFIRSIDRHHMIATGDEGWYCTTECNGNTYEHKNNSAHSIVFCVFLHQNCILQTNRYCDGYYGIDTVNNSKVPNISFMSMHLYPDEWGESTEWGNVWIANHTSIGHSLNKPVLLGEYGFKAYSQGSQQPSVYKQWTDTVFFNDTNGDLFWMLDGESDDPTQPYWVPNYDGYAIYCVDNSSQPSPPGDPQTCITLQHHASQMQS